jgi:hypothetical protein
MKIKPFILLAAGFSWLAADLNLIAGNVVLRNTRLAVIAQFLVKLPSAIGNSIDAFFVDNAATRVDSPQRHGVSRHCYGKSAKLNLLLRFSLIDTGSCG